MNLFQSTFDTVGEQIFSTETLKEGSEGSKIAKNAKSTRRIEPRSVNQESSDKPITPRGKILTAPQGARQPNCTR